MSESLLCITEVNSVISYLIINQGSSITEVSNATGISCENVFKILAYFHDSPFGGIFIYFQGYSDSIDLFTANIDIVYDVIKWYIDTSRIEKIPVENLTREEKVLLVSLLKDFDEKVICDFKNTFSLDNVKQGILTKTIPVYRNIFDDWKYHKEIKRAIFDKLCIEIEYSNKEQAFVLLLKPLGIVFYTDTGFWYLIAQNKQDEIFPYRIDRIKSVKLTGDIFISPDSFNLKDFADRPLGMEFGNIEEVEIIFKNEANVVSKASKMLKGRGQIEYNEDGALIFKGEIEGINFFKSWLRGFASSVIVIKPDWLKEDIVSSYRRVLKNYENLDYYKRLVDTH